MNRNTRRARKAGFASMYDQQNDGTKIYKGDVCNTARPAGKARWRGAAKSAAGKQDDDE